MENIKTIIKEAQPAYTNTDKNNNDDDANKLKTKWKYNKV